MLVISLDWRGCRKAQEILWGLLLVFATVKLDDDVDDEMLADASYHGSESFLKLPVYLVIKHIQKDDCLVSYSDVAISHEFDQQLFDEIERLLVV